MKEKNKEYVCWCSEVTEDDITNAIKKGAESVEKVIAATGAMKNCDCANKNPKGT